GVAVATGPASARWAHRGSVGEEPDVSVEERDAEEGPHHSTDEQCSSGYPPHNAVLRSKRGADGGHTGEDVRARHIEPLEDGVAHHSCDRFVRRRRAPHAELNSCDADHDETDATERAGIEDGTD